MSDDDDVGYGKPPKEYRFKPGVSGNPKGRRKENPDELGEIVQDTLNAPIQYREGGRTKTITRNEMGLRKLIEHAVKGDLAAAEQVLRVRAQVERDGEAGIERLEISDWLPDYPQQTADQKTNEFLGSAAAGPAEWWQQARDSSSKPEV